MPNSALVPTIYILAGPNGAGKTSLYEFEAPNVPRLNGDSLYQQGFTTYEVEVALRQQLDAWIEQKVSFVIETNAAGERDYKLFSSLKKERYRLELRYVGLESVAVCQQRISQRVLEGGHDVPPALVEQRYANGLSLLKQYYRIFDRLQLYDNTGIETQQVADLLPGTPLQQFEPVPVWAVPVLAHIKRMEMVYQRLK
ncbi:hypothetical protein H8B15_16285 [Hymenobacter sp. BT507]|uniref:UDP-N-acetylglucosamine kinase n=1 Tax=Hymenobacter citatus TaxID=2763506 RepID=A0ABR7MN23_9BACT|nr:hypothetical protein [Hymenobacter citatus]MBC6612484.1 hypothetical protein [Hymenobacter citatus]